MSKIINFKDGRLRIIKIPETVVFNGNNVEDVDGKEIILNYPYDLSKGNLQQANGYLFFSYEKNRYLLFDLEQEKEYYINTDDSLSDSELSFCVYNDSTPYIIQEDKDNNKTDAIYYFDDNSLLKFKTIFNANAEVTSEYMNKLLFIERLENDIVGVFDPIEKIHITSSYGNFLDFFKGKKDREYIYEINAEKKIVSVYYKLDVSGEYNKISIRRLDSYIERLVFNDVEYFVEKTISCEEDPIKAIYKPDSDFVMLASSNSSLHLKEDSGKLFICEINDSSQIINIYDVLHECFVMKTVSNSYFEVSFFEEYLFFFEKDTESNHTRSIYYSATGKQRRRFSIDTDISFSANEYGISVSEINLNGKIEFNHFFEYEK